MADFSHLELQKLLANIEQQGLKSTPSQEGTAFDPLGLQKLIKKEPEISKKEPTPIFEEPGEYPDPNNIPVPAPPIPESIGSLIEKGKVWKEQYDKSQALQPAPAPEPAAPMSQEPPAKPSQSLTDILNFGQNNLANQQGLLDAQKRQNDIQFLANMNRAAGQISSGIAQSGKPDTSMADTLDKQAKQPVEQYAQQIEFQKQDPNSPYSKGLKEYFKTKLGMDIQGEASAADLEKIMPFAVREYEAAESRAARKQEADENRKQRALDRKDTLDYRKAVLEQRSDDKRLAAQIKAEEKAKPVTKQLGEINDFDQTIGAAQDIADELSKMKAAIGPIQGRIPDLFTGAERLAFQAKVGRLNDQYRKLITGQAAGDKELGRIESRLPKITDTDAQFAAKLKDYQKAVAQAKNRYLDVLEGSGKNVSNYRDKNVVNETRNPDMRAAKIDAFLAKNPQVKSREEAEKILKDHGKL